MIWFWVTGVGLATAAGLWVYDKFVRTAAAPAT
jgi:hypothetical protein